MQLRATSLRAIKNTALINALTPLNPDFYVSNAGSDLNAGTLAAPFATLAKAVTVLANNKVIGLARGGMWRESMDFSTFTGVTVMGYGSKTLAMPRVDGTSIVGAGSWTLAATTANVYQASLAHTVINGYGAIWEDGQQLTPVASIAICDTTPGSFVATGYLSAAGTITIYVRPSTGIPTTNGKVYEAACRTVNLNGGFNANSVTDVWGSRPASNDGSIVAKTLTRCLSTEGSKHNLFVVLGGSATDCVCYKNTNGNAVGYGYSAMLVAFAGTSTATRTRITNNYFYATGAGALTAQGVFTHTGDASTLSGLDVTGVYGYYIASLIGVANTVSNTFKNVFAERCETVFDGVTGASAYENVIWLIDSPDGAPTGGNPVLINGGGIAQAKNIAVYASTTGVTKGIPNAVTGTVVENLSYYNGGGGYKHFAYTPNNNFSITLKKSVFYNVDRLTYFIAANADMTGNTDNIYYKVVDNLSVFLKGIEYTSLGAYKTARAPLDANSVNSDPLFTGTPSAGDFALSASSPANTLFAAPVGYQPVTALARPNWATLKARWDLGFLGIDGT